MRGVTKVVATLMMALAVTGCKDRIKIVSPELKPILQVKDPDPLVLKDVKWVVLTEANAQQTFARLRAEGTKPYVFALTEGYYQELKLNDAKLLKLIRQQRAIIVAYKRYYNGKGNPLERKATKVVKMTNVKPKR